MAGPLYAREFRGIQSAPPSRWSEHGHSGPYGSGTAERLATNLASRGLVIISGMARGVDTASHCGVFSAKGKARRVPGTGIDVIHPKENSPLSEQTCRNRFWRSAAR